MEKSRNQRVQQELEERLKKPKSREDEVETLATLAWELRTNQPERSAELSLQTIQEAQSPPFEEVPYYKGLAAGMAALAFVNLQVGEMRLGTQQAIRALKNLQRAPDDKILVRILLTLAQDSFFLGDFDAATEQAQKAVSLAEKNDWPIEKAWAIGMLASTYGVTGEIEKALELHQTELDIFEAEDDIDGILRAGNNLAMTLYLSQNLDKAHQQITKTLQLGKKRGHKFDLLNIHCTAAQIEIDRREFDAAEEALYGAFSNAEVLENTRTYHIFVLMEWARLRQAQQEISKAKSYYLQSLVLAEENGQLAEQAHCYQKLAGIYEEEGEDERAEKYLALAKELGSELEQAHAAYRKDIQTAMLEKK